LVLYLRELHDMHRRTGVQIPTRLEGFLADEATHRPIAGAVVKVALVEGEAVRNLSPDGWTDKNGRFERLYPPQGRYNEFIFSVEKQGYYPYSIMLRRGDAPPSQIVLKPLPEARERFFIRPASSEVTPFETLTPWQIEALPLPGIRSFDSLALLSPGVLPAPEPAQSATPVLGSGIQRAGEFSANGLRTRENNFTIDGADNNDEDLGIRRRGFVAVSPQPVDSIENFQIVTHLADARFGRNLGAQVNILSKSGGQRLHGSAYGFFTTDCLNARDFFDLTAKGAPPSFQLARAVDGAPIKLDGTPVVSGNPSGSENPLTQSQFGGQLGGRLGNSDFHFFSALEGQRISASRETHFAVPTMEQRGISLTGGTGFVQSATGQDCSDQGAGFPCSLFYPSTVPGSAVFSVYPLPNNPLGPYGPNTYTSILPAGGDGGVFSTKLDGTFPGCSVCRNLAESFSGRYNFTSDNRTFPEVGGSLFSTLRASARTQNFALFLIKNLAASKANTFRASIGRTGIRFQKSGGPSLLPSTFDPADSFLLNAPLLLDLSSPNRDGSLAQPILVSASSDEGRLKLARAGYKGFPLTTEDITGPLAELGIAGFSRIGSDVFNFPQERTNNTFQLADTYSTLKGDHSLAAGFDLRHTQINSSVRRNFAPAAFFHGILACESFVPAPCATLGRPREVLTGTTLASMGAPTGMFHTLAAVPNSHLGLRLWQLNFFIQDKYRFRSDFHVAFGLRYELNPVPRSADRRLETSFDRNALFDQAEEAASETICNVPFAARCADLVTALGRAFPEDFSVIFGSDRNNFAPRLGFAWAAGGRSELVLRGGYGVYFGQVLGTVINQARNTFPDFLPLNLARSPEFDPSGNLPPRLFNIANPGLGNTCCLVPGTINTSSVTNPVSLLVNDLFRLRRQLFGPQLGPIKTFFGLNLVLPDQKLKYPYAQHFGLRLEAKLRTTTFLRIAYVGTRGVKLLTARTPELGPNRSELGKPQPNMVAGELDSQDPTLRRGFPHFEVLLKSPQTPISSAFAMSRTLFGGSGSSTYHSFQLDIATNHSDAFHLKSAFTYSHTIDDASDIFDTAGTFALPQNSLDISERGPANFDLRLRSVTSFIWDLPRLARRILRGRSQLVGIWRLQTGQPFTVNTSVDINQDGNMTDRLNTTAGIITEGLDGPTQLRLAPGVDPASLLANPGEDGRVGRNTFRGPGANQLDLAVSTEYAANGSSKLLFRVEAFNVLNRTHFGIPVRILEAPAFGKSVSTTVEARRIQLVLKWSF